MNVILPVIVEELINKVSNSKLHPEQRQHWANTLYAIKEAAEKALAKYENDRKFRR